MLPPFVLTSAMLRSGSITAVGTVALRPNHSSAAPPMMVAARPRREMLRSFNCGGAACECEAGVAAQVRARPRCRSSPRPATIPDQPPHHDLLRRRRRWRGRRRRRERRRRLRHNAVAQLALAVRLVAGPARRRGTALPVSQGAHQASEGREQGVGPTWSAPLAVPATSGSVPEQTPLAMCCRETPV